MHVLCGLVHRFSKKDDIFCSMREMERGRGGKKGGRWRTEVKRERRYTGQGKKETVTWGREKGREGRRARRKE
jgi:hypothetical protein